MLPETMLMLMSVACTTTEDRVDFWSILPLETMLRSVVYAVARNHVMSMIYDLCC